MTSNYQLNFPPKILFGCGTIAKLADGMPEGAKVLLVVGNSAKQNGLLQKLLAILAKQEVKVVAGIAAEPPLEDVDKLLEAGRQNSSEIVVAVGGGSVMDAAKAAAALIPLEGLCADYFSGKRSIVRKGLPFIAAPTTAGTGAEITPNAVLTDVATKVKKSLRHPSMMAEAAIIDAELTLSCSSTLTAASGLDAFIQAVEGYTNPKANAVTMELSAKAVAKIFSSLEHACRYPLDIVARNEMAEGSMMSALAFAQTGLGAIHGLAHPIGSLLGVPHGLACAIVMKPVLEWNLNACHEEYTQLAKACHFGSAKEFIEEACALAERLGVPDNLKGYGFKREQFGFILKNCRSASMNANPRQMLDGDVEALLNGLLS